MKLQIHYRAAYTYEEKVGFSPHVVRLFPRQDHFVRIDDWKLDVNCGADVQLRRDAFDNPVAYCFLPEASRTLSISLDLTLVLREKNPFHFLLESSAQRVPFTLSLEKRALLEPYLAIREDEETGGSNPLVLPTPGQPRPTVDTLIDLNRRISKMIRYERRDEGAARSPSETLQLGCGACRDTAVLFATILRKIQIPARLVSGYLCEFDVLAGDRRAEGVLHAWTEAYLPGAGWVAFDPTNGVLCNHNFIGAAVGRLPEDVAPVAGSYFADHSVAGRMTATVQIDHIES